MTIRFSVPEVDRVVKRGLQQCNVTILPAPNHNHCELKIVVHIPQTTQSRCVRPLATLFIEIVRLSKYFFCIQFQSNKNKPVSIRIRIIRAVDCRVSYRNYRKYVTKSLISSKIRVKEKVTLLRMKYVYKRPYGQGLISTNVSFGIILAASIGFSLFSSTAFHTKVYLHNSFKWPFSRSRSFSLSYFAAVLSSVMHTRIYFIFSNTPKLRAN